MKTLKMILWIVIISGISPRGESSPSATGSGDLQCKSHVGCLSIIHGHSVSNGVVGPVENYLYLMIICPDIKKTDVLGTSSGVNGDSMSKVELDYNWKTATGNVSLPIFWIIHSEDVVIGKYKFNRKEGNVFTIIRSQDGQLEAHQCGKLGTHADDKEALQLIRHKCHANKLVSSVTFYGVDE